MTQTMNTISTRQGTRCLARYSFSEKLVLISSGGVLPGFISAQMTMYPENSAVSTKPGMNPARNTLMIETSAATAYTTMMIEGGSRMPSVPAAASEPRQVFSSYPRFFSSGSATLAIVAQVAAEDPDTVPNTAQPRMLTCIRRPGSQPSHGERPSTISSDSRVRSRTSPLQTSTGAAAALPPARHTH